MTPPLINPSSDLRTLDDAVLHLRQWASGQIHLLPAPPSNPSLIGASPTCAIRLAGDSIAPEHAQLTFDDAQWWIQCLGTLHGLRKDGIRMSDFVLTPGVEIGLGGVTLVAESVRTVRLRAFCQRLLGWGSHQLRAVDHALRSIRLATAHRASLILSGDGDLVPVAHSLHHYTVGHAAPFIVCDTKRPESKATARAPANVPNVLEAFTRAAGGTLCLPPLRLPADIEAALRRAHDPDGQVQLVLCTRRRPHSIAALSGTTINIPPLQYREDEELARIVQEYASDAFATLGLAAEPEYFTNTDLRWVTSHCVESLQDVWKATLRVVALNASSQDLAQAASRLGLPTQSLAAWLDSRAWPGLEADPEEEMEEVNSTRRYSVPRSQRGP